MFKDRTYSFPLRLRSRGSLLRMGLFAVGFWLIFSVSLASWWVIFGLRQLDKIGALEMLGGATNIKEDLSRHQKMLMWEGGVLIAMLLGGGVALAFLLFRENKRVKAIKGFFATFSHELKTSIASLRLQAESLQEDFSTKDLALSLHHKNLIHRLLSDSVRLELQLENSLFLANIGKQDLFIEKIYISHIIENLRTQWPQLEILLAQDARVLADRRALEGVFKNLVQNSAVHGRAEIIEIDAKTLDGMVFVEIHDNGKGFEGDPSSLGKLFERHGPTSGSGLGIYLAKQLMMKMDGKFIVNKSSKGFSTDLVFVSGDVIQ